MKITSLIENTSALGLPTEHGLSLFVEMESACFLFDMGQTDRFAQNARALGVDLNEADFAVISHGHYDHGGGMEAFFAANGHAPVYASRYAFDPYYDGTDKYIGLDPHWRGSERVSLVDGEKEIRKGITLHGGHRLKRIADFDAAGLNMLRDGRFQRDDFRHEQYLLVEENGRRVLFSGCSHRGILNIMRWFRPDILVGGFHMFRLPTDETLAGYARELDSYPTEYYTCHCTGVEQFEFMKPRMRSLRYLSAGESVAID